MKKKILIVEDDPRITKLMEFQLKKGDFEVLISYTGEEGLEKVNKEQPDLIILDIMMAPMNGYFFLQTLRSNPDTSKIPVICVSVLPAQSLELIVDDYIVKPYREEDLLKAINRLVEAEK